MISTTRTLEGGEQLLSSWYGNESGPKMANGHAYNKWAMTVAHRSLPFGTKLLLINLSNNKRAIVTVTDRGPFNKGRNLDCSYGVAVKLGFLRKGVQQLLSIRLNDLPIKPALSSYLQVAKTKPYKSSTKSCITYYIPCDMTELVIPLHSTQDRTLSTGRGALIEQPVYLSQTEELLTSSELGLAALTLKRPYRIINRESEVLNQPPPETFKLTEFDLQGNIRDSLLKTQLPVVSDVHTGELFNPSPSGEHLE